MNLFFYEVFCPAIPLKGQELLGMHVDYRFWNRAN